MKKTIAIFTAALYINTAMCPAFGAVYSSRSEISVNSGESYSSENIYSYSSGDKSSGHTAVFQAGSAAAEADGAAIDTDEPPYISEGRTMLPLRAVSEAVKLFENSVNISWDSNSKSAVILFGGSEVVFTAGSSVYTVNGESAAMEGGKPEIKNGRLFIPLRELAKAMNLNVSWDSEAKKITLTSC